MHLSVPLAALGETLVSALAGLLGVIVGALLAEWRERYKRRGETVSAARLVDAELADTLAKIEGAVAPQAGYTNKALALELETPAWLEARAALAQGLTPKQWGDVRDAFASVSALRVAIDADGGASGVEEQGRTAMNRIRTARETLAGF
jgi:hypothetical protein